MKFLYLQVNKDWDVSIKESLCTLEQTVMDFSFPEDINTREFVVLSEENRYALAERLQKKDYDFIFSASYVHEVSVFCNMLGVIYLSWTFEYPNMDILRDSVSNPCNCFFLSDKTEIERLRSLGVENVFYLPIGAKKLRLWKEEETKEEYQVGYMGKILEADPHSCFAQESVLAAESRGYLDGLVHCQRIIYGMNLLKEDVPAYVLTELKEKYPLFIPAGVLVSEWEIYLKKWIYNRVSSQERQVLLQENDDVVTVFSKDRKAYKYFSKTKVLGEDIERNEVIAKSSINLHIVDRQLQSGIPAEVFEIMSQGGFLLCNYWPDIEEFFVAEEDYMYFEDALDLVKKISFFSRNKNIRREMAKRAYDKVANEHLVIHRVERMLQILL